MDRDKIRDVNRKRWLKVLLEFFVVTVIDVHVNVSDFVRSIHRTLHWTGHSESTSSRPVLNLRPSDQCPGPTNRRWIVRQCGEWRGGSYYLRPFLLGSRMREQGSREGRRRPSSGSGYGGPKRSSTSVPEHRFSGKRMNWLFTSVCSEGAVTWGVFLREGPSDFSWVYVVAIFRSTGKKYQNVNEWKKIDSRFVIHVPSKEENYV